MAKLLIERCNELGLDPLQVDDLSRSCHLDALTKWHSIEAWTVRRSKTSMAWQGA